MRFLRTKYRPAEILHTGRTCDELLYDFHRNPREELVDYDAKFQALTRRVEEAIGIEIPPVLKAHMFLRKDCFPGPV